LEDEIAIGRTWPNVTLFAAEKEREIKRRQHKYDW
jgi:hypothetical protein